MGQYVNSVEDEAIKLIKNDHFNCITKEMRQKCEMSQLYGVIQRVNST